MNDHAKNASPPNEPNSWRDLYPDTRNLRSGGDKPDPYTHIASLTDGVLDTDLA